jgi:hypothetical protein
MGVWLAMPLLLWLTPGLFGLIEPATTLHGYVHDVGIAWLALGVAGLLFRVAQLGLTQNPRIALAWLLKILSDPFHDILLYHRAPLALLRGERYDPMHQVRRSR